MKKKSVFISDKALLRAPVFGLNRLAEVWRLSTRVELIQYLNELITDPIFKKALLVSSPSLSRQIEKGQLRNSEADTIFKFLTRASSRAVPFGLFATTAPLDLSEEVPNSPAIKLADRVAIKIVRSQMPDFNASPRSLALNPTLRKRKLWTYWHQPIETSAGSSLSSSNGAAAVGSYVPMAISPTPGLKNLVQTIIDQESVRTKKPELDEVRLKLYRSGLFIDASVGPFSGKVEHVKEVALPASDRFDSTRECAGTISAHETQTQVEKAIEAWQLVEFLSFQRSQCWEKICHEFYELYDLESVDFLEFVDRFQVYLQPGFAPYRKNVPGNKASEKILKAARSNQRVVSLDAGDIDFAAEKSRQSFAGDLILQICNHAGRRVYSIKQVSVGGAGKSMARFSLLSENHQLAYLNACKLNHRFEFPLEINHCFHNRYFAVGRRHRSPLRLLNLFAKPSAGGVEVKDLQVAWRDGKLFLTLKDDPRSIELLTQTAQIIFADSSPHLQLLMLIASQGRESNPIGTLLFALEPFFVPRVVYRGLILCRARWRVPTGLIADGLKSVSAYETLKHLGLPQRLNLVDFGDREVLIDLGHFTAKIFLSEKLSEPFVEFVESLDQEFEPIVSSEEGTHAAEIAVAFFAEGQNSANPRFLKTPKAKATPKSTSILEIEVEIEDVMSRAFLIELSAFSRRNSRTLKSFWFTRYMKVNSIFRIRFEPTNAAENGGELWSLIEAFMSNARKNGLILDFESRRYRPELAQYGGAQGLKVYEMISRLQSEVACEIERLRGGHSHDQILPFGYSSIAFTSALYCAWRDLKAFEKVFGHEFENLNVRINKPRGSECYQYCREHQNEINRLFDLGAGLPKVVLSILKKRDQEYLRLLAQHKREQKSVTIDSKHFYERFTHMNLNRLLGADLSDVEPAIVYQVRRYAGFLARKAPTDVRSQSPV